MPPFFGLLVDGSSVTPFPLRKKLSWQRILLAQNLAAVDLYRGPAALPGAAVSLEHFHKTCSDELRVIIDSGLFGFWLRLRSVAGFLKPALSLKPRQKPKILAAHRYIFSVNALALRQCFDNVQPN